MTMLIHSRGEAGRSPGPLADGSSLDPASACICREFHEDDWPDLVRFYQQFYRPDYIFTSRSFFDWNFSSPLRPDRRSGQHVAVDGTRIAGIMGALAWPLQVGGARELGEYNVNLMVDPAYRGRGLGEQLLAQVSSGYRYSVSSGYTPRSQSLYTRLGRIHHWRMRRLVKVLARDKVEQLMEHARALVPVSDQVANAYRDRIRDSASAAPLRRGRGMHRVLRFHQRWDDTWEVIRQRYGFTTWRDAEFLNWRYIDYPYPLYSCYAAGGGTTPAAMTVLRLERTPWGPVLRVVDLVCAPEAEDDTLAFVQAMASQAGAILIDVVMRGGPHDPALARAGYRELEGDDPGAMPLPMDFAPLRCRPRMLLLALLLGTVGYADAELAAGECYFVKGDGDQDRANRKDADGHA
jgi:GNAT superfamily N-acetyltransferase